MRVSSQFCSLLRRGVFLDFFGPWLCVMSLRLLSVCFAFGTVVLFPEVGVWIPLLDNSDLGTPSPGSDHICGQSAGPSFRPVFEGGEICRAGVSGHFLASRMFT